MLIDRPPASRRTAPWDGTPARRHGTAAQRALWMALALLATGAVAACVTARAAHARAATGWTAPITVATGVLPQGGGSVTVDGQGNQYFAYARGYQVVVRTRSARGRFGSPTVVKVPREHHFWGAPVVQANARGDAIVVWAQRTAAAEVGGIVPIRVYAVRRAPGRPFGRPERIDTVGGPETGYPAGALGPAGQVAIGWLSFSVGPRGPATPAPRGGFISRAIAGQPFSVEQPSDATSGPGTSVAAPAVTIGPRGEAIAVWTRDVETTSSTPDTRGVGRRTRSELLVTTASPGRRFGAPQVITAVEGDEATPPSLGATEVATAPGGRVAIAVQRFPARERGDKRDRAADVLVFERAADGSFGPPQLLTDRATGERPLGDQRRTELLYDRAGTLFVTWSLGGVLFSPITPSNGIQVAWAPRGQRFGAPQTFDAGVPSERPALATDTRGDVLLAWNRPLRTGALLVRSGPMVAVRPPGGRFGPATRRSSGAVASQSVSLGAGGRGSAVVGWLEPLPHSPLKIFRIAVRRSR